MAFEDQHLIPTAITATKPLVVTVGSHGLSNGQRLRATRFYTDPGASNTGMEQLNNLEFVVQNKKNDNFELWGIYGLPVDGSLYSAFINNGLGQFTRTGPELDYENEI